MRNYYQLDEVDLDYWINEMRQWLFANPGHIKYNSVVEALEMALAARKLLTDKSEFNAVIRSTLLTSSP